MTISGSRVHGQIRGALAQRRTAEALLSDRLYEAERRIARLTEEREQIYGRLAARWLPELNAETVKSTLREVQAEVARLYLERQTRRQALEKEMLEAADRRASLNAGLETLEGQRGAKAEEITALKARVVEELRAMPAYMTLRASLSSAQDETARVEELVELFAKQTAGRVPAYLSNRLFAYLLRRGYATEAYRSNAVSRRLDGWAAAKVDFHRQKAAYDVLHHGEALIRMQVEGRRGEAVRIEGQVQALERESAGRLGLLRALEESKTLDAEKAATLQRIAAAQEDWTRKTAERSDLDNTKGSHHVQALDRLKTFLKGETVAALKSRVGADDTGAVERIDAIDGEIRIFKKNARALQEEQAALARQLDGLHRVESYFLSNHYDSSRSTFLGSLGFDSYLAGFLAGQYTSNDLCSALDHHRYVEPSPSYASSSDSFFSSSSSFDSSSSASSFSSSDSGSSGFSSSGGGSDGGSSTGGGF